MDRTAKEQVSVSKQTQRAARGHYIQGSGEKAGGKCQTFSKSIKQYQTVSRCAKQQKSNSAKSADALSRKVMPGTRSGRQGNGRPMPICNQIERTIRRRYMPFQQMDRAVGSQRQAISWSRGNARQSGKGPRFQEDNAKQPAGRENKREQ